MTRRRNILCISPHPDDESIGPGGTLRKHVESRDRVHVVFLTSGEKGGHGTPPEVTAKTREAEARAAAKIIGFHAIEFWHMPDGAVRPAPPEVGKLAALLKRLKPAVVYMPHAREQHPDHRAAVRLLKAAVARVRGFKGDLLGYEVWTPIQKIGHIEDISGQIGRKLKAIRAYKCQCAVVGFAEAFEGLARYRGEMHSWPGGDFAEVFARINVK